MPKDFQEIPVILFVVSVIPYFHKLQAPLILSWMSPLRQQHKAAHEKNQPLVNRCQPSGVFAPGFY
jgi:hypothetical protein